MLDVEQYAAALSVVADQCVQRVAVRHPADHARDLAWPMATRAAFTEAFASGYRATDYRAPIFHRPEGGCYVLTKKPDARSQMPEGKEERE